MRSFAIVTATDGRLLARVLLLSRYCSALHRAQSQVASFHPPPARHRFATPGAA